MKKKRARRYAERSTLWRSRGPERSLNFSRGLPIILMRLLTVPTVDQYAASIVEKYHVDADSGSPAHRAAEQVIPLLKEWGKPYLQGITLSGAYAKNTAVSLSSHVDVLVVLNSVPGMEIKGIFWNLFQFLTDHDLRPHTHTVSIQVPKKEMLVDVIPACRDRASAGDTLFNKKSGAAVQTDIAQHVHLVANSGRQQEICALKVWRERAGLDFPSFYLELTVLQALEGERFGQLADNVTTALRYIANRFEATVVRDPANCDNVISNELSVAEKKAIAKAARAALYDENWKKAIW
jgi:hypothetical protein